MCVCVCVCVCARARVRPNFVLFVDKRQKHLIMSAISECCEEDC